MAAPQVICDTDVLIDYFDKERSRHNQTRAVIEDKIGLDQIALSAITKMELLAGAINKSELKSIDKKLS